MSSPNGLRHHDAEALLTRLARSSWPSGRRRGEFALSTGEIGHVL